MLRRAIGIAGAALALTSGVLAFGGAEAESAPDCPCSLLSDIGAPDQAGVSTSDFRSDPPPHSFELATAFTVDEPVLLTAVRFYKDAAETGAHVGRLWDRGTQAELLQVAFSAESGSGWQEQALGSAFVLQPGISYAISVNTNTHYVFSRSGIPAQFSSGPLTSVGDTKYGVYATSAGAFPGPSADALYYVDVVVDQLAPLDVEVVAPADGATGVAPSATVSAKFSRGVDPSALSGASFTLEAPGGSAVAGSVAYDAPSRTASFTAAGALAHDTLYTASLDGAIAAADGVSLGADVVWSFTTAPDPDPDPDPQPEPERIAPSPDPAPAAQADLSLSLAASQTRATVGDDVVLDLVVANSGFATATGVSVEATLSPGLGLVAASVDSGHCIGASVVRCSLGNVAVGQSVRIALSTRPAVSGTATIAASVLAPEPDPNYRDNGARGTVDVVARLLATADAGVTLRLVKTSMTPRPPTSAVRSWVELDASTGFAPARFQLALDPAKPWAWRDYLSKFSFRSRQAEMWIRFENAETITEWRRFHIDVSG